jgi:hypothetical protein
MSDLDTELTIAEYNNLWTERLNRITVRYQIVSIALLALGTILGLSNPILLLLYPILALFLLTAYVSNSYQSHKIDEYIRRKIEVRVGNDNFGWQRSRGWNKTGGILSDLGFLGARSVFFISEVIALAVGLSLKKYNLADPYVVTAIVFTFLTLILVLFKDWIFKSTEKLQKLLNTRTEQEPLPEPPSEAPISKPYEHMLLALEAANKMTMILYPNVDATTKVKCIQFLLPQLIAINNGKALSLDLPTPESIGMKAVAEDNQA